MPELPAEMLRKLYFQDGLSVPQIAKRLACSQHRVNHWIARHGLRKRSISDALYRRHNPNGDPFSVRSPSTIEAALLFGLGLGLYWGEGNKKNPSSIRLGNTDPLLINKFVLFLRDMLGVSTQKLRFGLQIFSDMDVARARSFWLRNLANFRISKNQFQSPVVTPARSLGTYRQKTQWGVLTVYCSNIKLKRILDEILAKHAV